MERVGVAVERGGRSGRGARVAAVVLAARVRVTVGRRGRRRRRPLLGADRSLFEEHLLARRRDLGVLLCQNQ